MTTIDWGNLAHTINEGLPSTLSHDLIKLKILFYINQIFLKDNVKSNLSPVSDIFHQDTITTYLKEEFLLIKIKFLCGWFLYSGKPQRQLILSFQLELRLEAYFNPQAKFKFQTRQLRHKQLEFYHNISASFAGIMVRALFIHQLEPLDSITFLILRPNLAGSHNADSSFLLLWIWNITDLKFWTVFNFADLILNKVFLLIPVGGPSHHLSSTDRKIYRLGFIFQIFFF